jgi:hypothetical protein
MELHIGELRMTPPEGLGIVVKATWTHVAFACGRRSLTLYVGGKQILYEMTSGTHQFTGMTSPQTGAVYIGLPPPDLVPFSNKNFFFPGYLYNLTYHDNGLREEEVATMAL